MHKFFLLVCVLSAHLSAWAGNIITGMVYNSQDSSALIAVTVKALTQGDSTAVATTQSDPDGNFRLANVPNGNYVLELSYVGLDKIFMTIDNLNRNLDLGRIALTPSAQVLDEVVVKASRVTHKIDRQVILPSKQQLQASPDGLALLQNMQITGLSVNVLEKSVKTLNDKDVQLRINGVEASMPEVQAIRPNDVIRIEYHDNPGLRYGHADAVVDYIVRHKDSGGNLNADAGNNINNVGWGEYQLGGRYNRGKSSFQLLSYMSQRSLNWKRENLETYVYPDTVLSNTDIGEPTKFQYYINETSLTYTYTDEERSLLNVSVRNSYTNTPNDGNDRRSTLTQGNNTYRIVDHQHSWEEIPSLNVYYQRSIARNQRLYFDLVGTLMSSSTHRTFNAIAQNDTTAFQSHIDGCKKSLIGEAIYEKMFSNSRFTAGLKHMQSHVNNTYNSQEESRVRMNAAETYAFAEFQSMLHKLNYTVGLGVMRTFNSQAGHSQEKYIVRPTLSLSIQPGNHVFLRYKFYISGYSPSLSQLSDVTQDIDSYQSRRGNPALKTVTFYSNELMANWKCDFMNINLWGNYSYDHKPIMEETLFENGQFIRTYDNQRGFHRIQFSTSFKFFPFGEHLQVSVSPFFNRFISLGNNYTHTFSNWGVRGNIQLLWKNWMVSLEGKTRHNNLWGEEIVYGEKWHSIATGYNTEKWSVFLTIFNPFSKHYSVKHVNLAHLAPNTRNAYNDLISRLTVLRVSINLDFGKQSRAAQKRINNSDTNTGILTGTK